MLGQGGGGGGGQMVFQAPQDFTNTLRGKDKMFSARVNIQQERRCVLTERCGIRLNLAGAGPQLLLLMAAAAGRQRWMEDVTTAIPQTGAEARLGE